MNELVLLARQEAREEEKNGRPAHAALLRRLADEVEHLEHICTINTQTIELYKQTFELRK